MKYKLKTILFILSLAIIGITCKKKEEIATTGNIQGSVKNTNNQPIEGVAIKINTTPNETTVFSKADGSYSFLNLSPQGFQIAASKEGYTSNTQNVTVVAGETKTLDFALITATSLTINLPASGTNWNVNTQQTITWTSAYVTGSVKIELLKAGAVYRTLESSTENDGTYTWTIPYDISPSTDYKIKISSLTTSSVFDESDYFSISTVIATLSVLPLNQNVSFAAATITYTVTSNTNWIATTDSPSWCTVTPNGNGTLTVTFTENKTTVERIATITISTTSLKNKNWIPNNNINAAKQKIASTTKNESIVLSDNKLASVNVTLTQNGITSSSYPTVTTYTASNVTQNTASIGGNVTSDGGAAVTARGVCWSNNHNPTIGNSLTVDGVGTGNFTSNLTALSPGTTYYIRAYATYSVGTAYGNEVTINTLTALPTLTTTAISNITATTAKTGGNIRSTGGAAITARGVCWSTSQNPTISDNKTDDGTETGNFTSSITGLTPETKYYVRAYATNSVGTAYGNQIIFTTTKIVQMRLNQGETPLQIYNSGIPLDSLYGKTYQGGLIFHLNEATGKGLVAAPNDQSSSAAWGCIDIIINGADSWNIGAGVQNTIDIINGCSEAGIAARLCADLVLGGYSDWFLPSKSELQAMYNNLHLKGYGGFVSQIYWSSTEDYAYAAWFFYFNYGIPNNGDKTKTYYVRAVRAF